MSPPPGFAPISLAVMLALPPMWIGCGGVIKFEDRAAISVSGTPQPPAAEAPQARVELREDRIVINEKIQFAYNDARILPESFSLLSEVAKVMNDNPQIKRIEIGGHASTEGSDDHNLRLSDRRAKAVMEHLIKTGKVTAERLAAKGYGETRPLVSPDDTEAARETNRRVEFLILDQDVTKRRVEVDPNTGEERVLETVTEAGK